MKNVIINLCVVLCIVNLMTACSYNVSSEHQIVSYEDALNYCKEHVKHEADFFGKIRAQEEDDDYHPPELHPKPLPSTRSCMEKVWPANDGDKKII